MAYRAYKAYKIDAAKKLAIGHHFSHSLDILRAVRPLPLYKLHRAKQKYLHFRFLLEQ